MHFEKLLRNVTVRALTSSRLDDCSDIIIYYIDTSVLLENILLVKFIKTTSGTRVVYFP